MTNKNGLWRQRVGRVTELHEMVAREVCHAVAYMAPEYYLRWVRVDAHVYSAHVRRALTEEPL